jgi:hypothetical protein
LTINHASKSPGRALRLFCKLDQGNGFILFNKTERFLMGHPSFKHRQTSDHGQFLPGGKLGFYVCSKNAKCEFIHGCIFIQWINFERLTIATFPAFRKSFETGTYNNTKNTSTNHPSTKTISKNCPLDKFTAAEGVFRKISHWPYPKKQHQNEPPKSARLYECSRFAEREKSITTNFFN